MAKDKKQFRRIYVEITNICNLACRFCPQDVRKKSTMTLEQFSHIIKEIVPFTDYVYLHIKGEPLLHPDLGEILKICHKEGLKINITTNGTLFEKNSLFKTPVSGLRQVNISLHSFGANEQVLHSFDEKEQALHSLGINEQARKGLGINEQVKHGFGFYEYLQQCFRQGEYFSQHTETITAYRLWNFKADGELSEENRFVLEQMKDYFQLSELPLPQGGRGVKIKERIYLNFDKEFVWPDLKLPVISENGYCHGGIDQLGILVDGTVVPCCLDQNGAIALGNIFYTSLEEMLKAERMKNLKEGFLRRELREELCKKCGYATRFQKGMVSPE